MIFDVLSVIFKWVINTSLIASFAVGIILILKKCAGNKLNPNWQYCLWIIVVIRLVVPFNFYSRISIFNYLNFNSLYASSTNTTEKTAGSTINEDNKNITQSTKDINNKQIKISKQTDNKRGLKSINNKKSLYVVNTANSNYSKLNLSIFDIAAVIWFFSIAALLLYMLFIQCMFNKKIQKGVKVKCTYLINMINDCKRVMGITKNIELVRASHIKSPALYGVIKPIILLPEVFDASINSNDLRYILFHELSHYKRKDIIMNYICNIIQIVYFFNPVIWYGFYKMKNDRESACDNMALSFLGEETKIEYGKTILKLVKSYSDYNLVIGLAGIQSSKHIIKERVQRIKVFEKSKLKLSIINVIVIILAAVFLLTTTISSVSIAKDKNNKNKNRIDTPYSWVKPLKGKYTYVFSDKTKITVKRLYINGKEFEIEFIEELNRNSMKNYKIYSLMKDKQSTIKPKKSYDLIYPDMIHSIDLPYKPKGKAIKWGKIFLTPKSLNKNYRFTFKKKVGDKEEKCEIKIPLYKGNINIYKETKLNKVLKIKDGTITFKSINVSPNLTVIKERLLINQRDFEQPNSPGAPIPHLEYSFFADGKGYFKFPNGEASTKSPTSDSKIFRYISNSQSRYVVGKPNIVKIKDIKVALDTYKNKFFRVPIPCNNKVISLYGSKLIIKRTYRKGKKVYFEVEYTKVPTDLIVYMGKDSSRNFCDGFTSQSTRNLKNGHILDTYAKSVYTENYIIMNIGKKFKKVLASYPGQVDISIKKNQ